MMDEGEVDFTNEFIKDPSFVGTKADCVLKELIATGNNVFRKTSEAFTQNRSKFKLRFTTINNTNTNAGAQTPFPNVNSNGIISIEINLSVISGSNHLSYANTILHESIHAELHRLKLSGNSGSNPLPNDLYDFYMYMWDFYEEVENPDPNYVATQSQHYFRAQYYVDNIANGLKEFNGNQKNIEEYKYLAWERLQKYGKNGGFITQAELNAMVDSYSQVPKNLSICDDY